MATTYYIRIDGVAGDSTDKGRVGWFELSSFSLGESNNGETGASGKISFQDLNISLLQNTALADLFSRLGLGSNIAAIEIEGVDSTASGEQTVFDLTLNNVSVNSVSYSAASSTEPASSVTLAYGQIGLVTTSYDDTGNISDVQSFGWDLGLLKEIDPASLNAPNSSSIAAVPDPVTYFVRIDGVDGDSTVEGYEGWFELPSLNFVASIETIPGGGSSRPEFQDLAILLKSETALATLLAKSAAGELISALEVEGVVFGVNGANVVYDLTLNEVQVTSVNQSVTAGSGETSFSSVSFNYGQIGLVTTSVDSASGAESELAFGWDVTANSAIDPATLIAPASSKVSAVPDPVTYYLKIDGVAGDSTIKGFEGWIELPTFFLGASNGGNAPNFTDLTVSFDSDTALASLLALGASGKQVKAVEILGVSGGATPKIIYDLKLNDVSVVSAGQNEGDFSLNSFSFEFDKIGLVTTSINPDGTTGPAQSFGWDLKAVSAINPASLATPTNMAIDGVPEAAVYYLRIDGVNGDATAKGYEGWFELPSFSFGESNFGGFGGGLSFQDLNLSLANNAALTALLARVADGKSIAAIEIEGVAGGQSPLTVYDLILNNVSVTSVGDGGPTSASFSFGQIGLITTNVDDNGAASGQQSFGWDLTKATTIDPSTLFTPTSVQGDAVPTNVTYFLKIDGVAGDSTDAAHKGWFELSSFDIGGANQGGAVSFDDLLVTLDSEAVAAALLSLSASGKHITALEIEGVSSTGKTGQLVYELTLNDLIVSSVQEQSDAGDTTASLSFNFSKIGLVTTGINPDGTPGDRLEFGWDLATNTALDPDNLTQAKNTFVNPVPEPTTYYLKIDGIEGDSTNANYKGWFELNEFSFGEVNLSGSGSAASGIFQDLSVSVGSEALLAALMSASANGVNIVALEIQGVVDNGGNPLVVYDLILNDILVTSTSLGGAAGAGGLGTKASFDFGKIGLTTTSVDAFGAVSEQEFGWDALTKTLIDPDTLISPDADNIAPNVAIDSQSLVNDTGVASDDFITSDGRVELAGTASDNRILTSVHIFDGATDLGAATLSGSNWTFAYNLGEGAHTLLAVATDSKGNSTSTAVQPQITVDKTAPEAGVTSQQLANDTGSSTSDRVTSDGRVTLTGTASDGVALASLHIFYGAVDLGAATLNGTDWSFDVTLPEGAYSLFAVSTDAAGNTISTVAQPQIVVDQTGPLAAVVSQTLINDTGVSPTDLVTSDGRVVLAGTASDGVALASVHIFDGATDLGAATINGTDWSFSFTLPVGVHTLVAVATDAAGNVTTTDAQPEITVVANDPIVGQPGQRTVNGTEDNDTIIFGTTNRTVNANGGDDVIALAAGSTSAWHFLNGGDGVDTLDLSGTTSGSKVNLAKGLATGPEIGRSVLISIENVIGGAGDDTFIANGQVNELAGGAGADTFSFLTLSAARNGEAFDPSVYDTITDFQSLAEAGALHDVINLERIDAIRGIRNNAFTLNETPWDGQGAQFTAAGQLSYQYAIDANGREITIISGNIDSATQGNGLEADFQIVLYGHQLLSASDFIL